MKKRKMRVIWCLKHIKNNYILSEHFDSRSDARYAKGVDIYGDMKEFRIVKFIEADKVKK